MYLEKITIPRVVIQKNTGMFCRLNTFHCNNLIQKQVKNVTDFSFQTSSDCDVLL